MSVVENKPDGYGSLLMEDGTIYTGEFKRGERSGKGMEVCPDGAKFTGLFDKGKRSGFGIHKW